MLFKQTIDGIISDITKKIEQLHIVADLHAAEAEIHNAIALERAKLAAFAKTESARAKSIAEKLRALVS